VDLPGSPGGIQVHGAGFPHDLFRVRCFKLSKILLSIPHVLKNVFVDNVGTKIVEFFVGGHEDIRMPAKIICHGRSSGFGGSDNKKVGSPETVGRHVGDVLLNDTELTRLQYIFSENF
jgi:hypothetical protein